MQNLKLLMLAVIVVIVGIGCKKSNDFYDNRVENIINKSESEQIKFVNKNLQIITLEIAKLSKDKNFRNFVKQEASKKFDQEYEVLINDLKKNPLWKEKLNTKALNEALDKFKNIGGKNYFPHIYIPKMQYQEDNGKIETSNSKSTFDIASLTESIEQEPLFVFSPCDGINSNGVSSDICDGYTLNEAGDALLFVGMVDEDFANLNEVWVIALNESVDDGGIALPILGNIDPGYYVPDEPPGNAGQIGTTGISTVQYDNSVFNDVTVNCKITLMSVKMHKESWFSGASDVSVKAVLTCHNGRAKGEPYPAGYVLYTSDQTSDRRGNLIRKFRRKEIKNQETINVDYSLQTNWPSGMLRNPSNFDFIIFESDGWPANQIKEEFYRKPDYRFANGGLENPYFSRWEDEYRSQKRDSDPEFHTPYMHGSICNTTLTWDPVREQYYLNGRFKKAGQIDFINVSY